MTWQAAHRGKMARMEGTSARPESSIDVFTAEERPDLWEQARSMFQGVWPEYNHHGNHTGRYFGALVPRHARLQVLLCDRGTDDIVARGRTIPFRWDCSLEDLPAGIDAVGLRAVDDPRPPTALSALAAEVAADQQGRGLSRLVIEAMATAARTAGLAPLVAPVRPSWKDRYQIEAPVAEWELWTEMTFPEDGEYVFPAGLALLRVRDGIGDYWEPNVWMLHNL